MNYLNSNFYSVPQKPPQAQHPQKLPKYIEEKIIKEDNLYMCRVCYTGYTLYTLQLYLDLAVFVT